MAYVAIDKRIALVVLVDHVESFAVPDTKVESLAVHDVVAEDAVQFFDSRFEVDHDLGR